MLGSTVFAMSAVMLAALFMMTSVIIRLRAYGVGSCDIPAYSAAETGLRQAVYGQLGNYATNCQPGQYLIPNLGTCGQPGEAGTVISLDNSCTYSVEYGGLPSGNSMTLRSIGSCTTGRCAVGATTIKIDANISYLQSPGPTCPTGGNSAVDLSGNNYNLVWYDIIPNGQQDSGECWFASNLKTTASLTYTAGDMDTSHYLYAASTGVCSSAPCEDSGTVNDVGLLYKGTMLASLCPSGWHVPTTEEFTAFNTFLGTDPGYKLRTNQMPDNTYWTTPANATGWAQFNAVGAGYHEILPSAVTGDRNTENRLWTSDNNYIKISDDSPVVTQTSATVNNYYSVRCVQD